jgi:hypothetical protein
MSDSEVPGSGQSLLASEEQIGNYAFVSMFWKFKDFKT